MNHSSSRKRPFTTRGSLSDNDPEEANATDVIIDNPKKNKSVDPVQDVALISKDEAWKFDTSELLDSHITIPALGSGQIDGNNFKRYDSSKSLFLLCVVGEMTLQLDLLCSVYSTLIQCSPNIQSLVLTRESKALTRAMETSPICLPVVETQGNPANHFLKLGLLHPLGGGRQPLDAMVVIDTESRRRMVLPFGWGAGRHISDPVTGPIVQQRFIALLINGVQTLEREKADATKDFYDTAMNRF
ncbi:uncharacterized protein PV09_07230 [Verruconis gallopava]|uniref:Uncharacterized protein n=1 Tax=Verruconis gallopava TaxID=253628 RepID=A0A0D1XGZ8_9PEZI|nr:uncharacterized protein PV09_07230 [Verruconis gallopava]KIW01476.1 hypothetical protein PV09_07230 [Verruconis gallopava]